MDEHNEVHCAPVQADKASAVSTAQALDLEALWKPWGLAREFDRGVGGQAVDQLEKLFEVQILRTPPRPLAHKEVFRMTREASSGGPDLSEAELVWPCRRPRK